jgi:hypothetical protein
MDTGEANTGADKDIYACNFAKMIQYWRQMWNNRTNGITDIQFPFGFVQVSFRQKSLKIAFHRLKDFYT